MDYKALLEKYNLLLNENSRLTKENNILKAKLGITKSKSPQNNLIKITAENTLLDDESIDRNCFSDVNRTSDSLSKIRLFMSLFKGRDDVYAKRWENKSKGTSGYSPVCLNQWQTGVCGKPKISCSKCEHKLYAVLDEDVIENHLRGNIVVGIYPMLPDETCCFLAMDFDKAEWKKDISVLRDVCVEFNIPVAVERSRSGKGGHVWFF
ncbi:MAG: TOTE conflict system archaeo-eukaryotic primase domain-containing protein, partial [bacterium]